MIRCAFFVAIALACFGSPVASDAADSPSSPFPDATTVAARAEQVSADETLPDAVRTRAAELYTQAVDQIRLGKERQETAGQFRRAMKEAPRELRELRARLTHPRGHAPAAFTDDAPTWEIEQALVQAEVDLALARRRAADLAQESAARAGRRSQLYELLTETRIRAEQVEPVPAGEHEAVRQALALLGQARVAATAAERTAYEMELLTFDVRGDILTTRMTIAEREASAASERVDRLRTIVNDRRRRDAARAASEAIASTLEAQDAHPTIRELAAENAELARRRVAPDGPLVRSERIARRVQDTTATLAEVESKLQGAREKEDIAGLTASYGLMLRRLRDEAPNVTAISARLDARGDEIAEAGYALARLEDQRTGLRQADAWTATLMRRIGASGDPGEREKIETILADLLRDRRENLDALIAEYEKYYNALIDLETYERRLVDAVDEFVKFIDERVLWVRSSHRVHARDLKNLPEAIGWLFGPSAWTAVALSAGRRLAAVSIETIVYLLVLFIVLPAAKIARDRAIANGERAAAEPPTSISPTVAMALYTVALALPAPYLLWFLGRIANDGAGGMFPFAVAAGLKKAAGVLLLLILTRETFRENGLGEVHFWWSGKTCRAVRRAIATMAVFAVPLVFIIFATQTQEVEARRDSLGRFAFVALQLTLAAFAFQLTRPKTGITNRLLPDPRDARSRRRHRLISALFILPPLALAAAGLFGYQFTALELGRRLFETTCMLLAIVAARAFTIRWLFVARTRHAALPRVLEETGSEPPEDADEGVPADPDAAMHAFSAQTIAVLRVVWIAVAVASVTLIWRDMLPALAIFDQVELWTTTETIESVVQIDGGETETHVAPTQRAVTLLDLLTAFLIVAITIVVGRNLPGILQVAVLARMHVDRGAQYAITTILKYVITIVGVAVMFGALGIGWSKVQWLAAAVTVGLGFGLQEIFANFVSGLIILVERPIRVGDIVTIGDISGNVTRIRIRATTVRTWDLHELIVPNKAFITGQLVNWTLTDTTMRVVLPVSVAYGSDPDRVGEILLDIARRNPRVIPDPPPSVIFKEMGESSLNFEFRVFVGSVQVSYDTMHELNTAIYKALAENGIEIPFPQRDVHIRSMPEFVRAEPATDEAASTTGDAVDGS
ncbi:mechanosensitive ion channel [bacterium]|nr:mechanosensitive ion channel [bacterium]